jgi:outer membrane biogenesis lipoprotein LolB
VYHKKLIYGGRRKLKKIVLAIAAGVAVFSLAACGGSKEKKTENSTDTSSKVEEAKEKGSSALDEAKDKASDAVETGKTKASEAVEKGKEKVEEGNNKS